MAASVAASVVWLTAGGLLLATRVSDLSAVLADWAVTLLGFAAALDSGFLIGTGAFDYTTTCLFRIKFLAVRFVPNLRLRTCRPRFDNTTTYLHPLTPGQADRPQQNSTAVGKILLHPETCVGARNHDWVRQQTEDPPIAFHRRFTAPTRAGPGRRHQRLSVPIKSLTY